MLKPSWVPTPLVPPDQQPAVPIVAVQLPARFRTLYVFANFAALAAALLLLLLARRFDRRAYARRVRVVFERMGGLWIKAGQLLSLRIDIFPVEICRELANLQSQALGFSGEIARQIIEQDLGVPIEQYFDHWDPVPRAAASIGQVHRARLRHERVWVAIKVQKPLSADLFARDLTVIRLAVQAMKWLRIYPHMKWDDGFRELSQIMIEELDFEYEAASTRRMRRNLRRHGVYVPRVFSRYSSSRVFVTEWVPAVLMADYIRVAHSDPQRLAQWRDENRFDPKRVAVRLVHTFQRQLFEDNLFHGDMHPGNIGLLRRNRIVLIDFGTTNFTDAEYLKRVEIFMAMLASTGFAKAADMCLMLCASLPVIDIEEVRGRLVHVIRAWSARTLVRELPYHDKSLDNLTLDIMRVLLGFRCTMEWAFLRIHRGSSTLDASLIELYPGINYRKVTARHFEAAGRRRASAVVTAVGARRAMQAVAGIQQLPARARDYALFQGEAIRRHVQVFTAATNRFARAVALLLRIVQTAIVVQAAVMVGAALMPPASALPAGPFAAMPLSVPRPEWPLLSIILLIDGRAWYAMSTLRHQLQEPRGSAHQQTPTTG